MRRDWLFRRLIFCLENIVGVFAACACFSSALQGGFNEVGKSRLPLVTLGDIGVQIVDILYHINLIIDLVFIIVYWHYVRPFS